MSALDNQPIDEKSFAYRDQLSIDKWDSFTPVFTSLTTVGTTSFSGRYRLVGRSCQFEVQVSAGTSIASVAGTTYMALPVSPAKGIAGMAIMSDKTANTAVGTCHIDVTNSRCYLPAQGASGHVFNLCGSYEI